MWRLLRLPEDVGADSAELIAAHRWLTAGRHTRLEDAVMLVRGLLIGWRAIPEAERSGCGYYAAAALLAPGALAAIRGSNLIASVYEPLWRELAASVAEPARSICLALADRSRGRAA